MGTERREESAQISSETTMMNLTRVKAISGKAVQVGTILQPQNLTLSKFKATRPNSTKSTKPTKKKGLRKSGNGTRNR